MTFFLPSRNTHARPIRRPARRKYKDLARAGDRVFIKFREKEVERRRCLKLPRLDFLMIIMRPHHALSTCTGDHPRRVHCERDG